MERNAQKEMTSLLRRLSESGQRPRLLLHACCGPCSSYVLEYLARYFEITVFYFNPNTAPEEEYRRRGAELARLLRELPAAGQVELVEGAYQPERFYEAVRGLEEEREGGARCFACYGLRLRETAAQARERGFDFFTSTLSISPYKNAAKLNELGEALSEELGVRYLWADFKKKGGYQRSIELSREYSLYRQEYCGCAFSYAEAQRRRG